MENNKYDKTSRVLDMMSRLNKGDILNKAEAACNYQVNERTVQRDIEDINIFLQSNFATTGVITSVVYDRKENGYRIEKTYSDTLTNSETLAVCKILLDSRAFKKDEMKNILKKLISCCVPEKNKKTVEEMIQNELHHYIELRHKTDFLDILWDMAKAIRAKKMVEILYKKTKGNSLVKRKLKPVGIMFSEYYFYIAAFIDDEVLRANFDVVNDANPTIYRLDRIKECKILNESSGIAYKDRFEEGEFRKRIQFMYGGRLQRIRFEYTGFDVDSILDRLPTAIIESEKDGHYIIKAEVFGKGIDMWLRSQGENVRLIGDGK